MKKSAILMAAAFFCALWVGAAFAWELELKGESVWRYRYFTRTGDMDIFGPAGVWPNLGVNHLHTYPSPNANNEYGGTYGVIAGEPGFGADKDMNDFMVNLYPKVTINPAVELRGMVNLTSLGVHSAGQPYDLAAGTPGAVNEFWAPISNHPAGIAVPNTFFTLAYWLITVKTPAVDFALGYRGNPRGVGLVYNALDRAGTSLGVSVAHGPFKFSFGPYLGRQGSRWGGNGERDAGHANTTWRKDTDRNYLNSFAGALIYSDGPFMFLINTHGYTVSAHSTGNGSYVPRLGPTASVARRYSAAAGVPAADAWHFGLHISAKYYDGRFFFNSEVARFLTSKSGRGAAVPAIAYAGVPGTPLNMQEAMDADNLAWAYGAETGAVVGPLKTTLSYFRATGDDPNTRKGDEELGHGCQGISSTYVKDWARLMYYTYGAGNYWDAAGKGTPSNLHHVGARMDYAAASNLNLFAVCSYAWRDQPNAFQLAGNWLAGAQRFANTHVWALQNGGGAQSDTCHQAVPDHARGVGWEADAGWDWKILENFTWVLTAAYWKPGNWWAFAFPNTAMIYRTQPRDGTAVTPGTEAQATADLGRDIDPLIALDTSLRVEF